MRALSVVKLAGLCVLVLTLAGCGSFMAESIRQNPLQANEMVFYYSVESHSLHSGKITGEVPHQVWAPIEKPRSNHEPEAAMHRIDKRGIGVVRTTATDHYLFISGQPGDFFWSSRPNQQITMEATAGGAIYIGQITYHFGDGRFGISIRDDYERATAEFLKLYPQYTGKTVKALAKKGWRSGIRLYKKR